MLRACLPRGPIVQLAAVFADLEAYFLHHLQLLEDELPPPLVLAEARRRSEARVQRLASRVASICERIEAWSRHQASRHITVEEVPTNHTLHAAHVASTMLALHKRIAELCDEAAIAQSIVHDAKKEKRQTKKSADRKKAARKATLLALRANAEHTRKLHESQGVTEYVWSTSDDERTRPDHKALDGKRFAYADPPVSNKTTGTRANPGEDYGCRCVAIPVISRDVLAEPMAQPSGGRANEKVVVRSGPTLGYMTANNIATGLKESRVETARHTGENPELSDARQEIEAFLRGQGFATKHQGKPMHVVRDGLLDKGKDAPVSGHNDNGLIRIIESVRNAAISGFEKLERDQQSELTVQEVRAIKTLLHEFLHSTSPMGKTVYTGWGLIVEEATNELATRIVAAKAMGVDHRLLTLDQGSPYQGYIDQIAKVIQSQMRGASRDWILAEMASASTKMRSPGAGEDLPYDKYIWAFVKELRLPPEWSKHMNEKEIADFTKRTHSALLNRLGVKVRFDSNGATMEKMPFPIMYIPRNDPEAAIRYYLEQKAKGVSSEQLSEDAEVLCKLQDVPEEMLRRLRQLNGLE